MSGRRIGARWASTVASDIGRATYASEKTPRSEAPGRCQMNGGRCRKPGSDLRAERHEARRHGELHCRSNPLGVVVGQLHRGDGAHVVGDEVGALDVEGVEEGEQVAEPGLAFDTRIVGHGPAGPAQVGADDAVAALRR